MPDILGFDLGERLILGPTSTTNWSLEQDLALSRALGMTQMNTAIRKLGTTSSKDWLALFSEAGLRIDTVWLSGGFDLSQSSWADQQAELVAQLHTASELGARRCAFTGGSGHGSAWERAAARFAEAVQPLVQTAADLDIRLLLEVACPQYAYVSFVHSLRDGVSVARATGLGIVFDVVHCWWEAGLGETIANNADLVGLVQLSDLDFSAPITERIIPGDGQLPLGDLVGALLGSGYEGHFEIELIGSALEREGYEHAVSRALEYLRRLNPKSQAE